MAPIRTVILLFFLLLSLTPFMPPSASASVVIPVGLTQLTQRVDTIVAGVVTDTRSYWDEGRIYTDITIETMEYLKHPSADRPKALTIQALGGKVGDMRMEVQGVPHLKVDDEGVFFLKQTGSALRIFGLHYGLCRIDSDPETGTQMVSGAVFSTRTTQDLNTQALTINPLPPTGEELGAFFNRVKALVP